MVTPKIVLIILVVATQTLAAPEGCYYSTGISLYCTNIEEVPENIPPEIEMLKMYNNSLYFLSDYTFESLKNLQMLVLQKCEINYLKPKTFSGIKQLKYLFITENELTEVPSASFEELVNLEVLSLSRNRIQMLNRTCIKDLRNLRELYVSQNNITYIDPYLISDNTKMKKLILNGNHILFNKEPILHSESLKYLSMNRCNISSIASEFFEGLPQLATVSLKYNNLIKVDYRAFLSLYSLQEANLDGNYLECDCNLRMVWKILFIRRILLTWICADKKEEISYSDNESAIKNLGCDKTCYFCNCFDDILNCSSTNMADLHKLAFHMTSFSVLDISNNSIASLTRQIFKDLSFTNLEKIYLSNNILSDIEDYSFMGLGIVNTLDLTNNKLVKLNQWTFHGLEDLKILALAGNKISVLSENVFKNIKNIEMLDLSDNNLTTIRGSPFTGMSNMTFLSLANNKLITLKAGMFKRLAKLRELSLNNNHIAEIEDETFVGLSNLIKLNLGSNNLSAGLEDSISELENLQELNLNDNSIKYIARDNFYRLINLRLLNIANNNLQNLTSNAFISLTKLKILNLEGNLIQSIDPCVFESLQNLETLALNRNNISDIQSNLFKKGMAIRTLDLSENNLKTIKLVSLEKLSHLKYLYILANPLICDCKLKETYDWCSSQKIETKAVCNSPLELSHHKWDVLNKLSCTVQSTTSLSTSLNNSVNISEIETSISKKLQALDNIPDYTNSGTIAASNDLLTKPNHKKEQVETTMFVLQIARDGYYNSSFSQHTETDAQISSIILYLLITLCILFCILAGLLAKFVFKNRQSKTPSKHDLSMAEDSEIHNLNLYQNQTGIENENFDDSRPATTGPICLPMMIVDTSRIATNSVKVSNCTSLHPHQHTEIAIVHRSEDGLN